MRDCCRWAPVCILILLVVVASVVEAAQSFIVSGIRVEGLEKIPEGTLFRDGDVLVVRVKERPSISDITFDGNSDIDDETLEEAMKGVGLARGRIFNRSLLEKLTQELESVYFSQGKYNVRITTTVEELDNNRVNIDIDISEGIKSGVN